MPEEVYGKEKMNKTKVYEWYKRFCDDHPTIKDHPHCGLPSAFTNDENIGRVLNTVQND
jgi:hypothetical protein